MAYSVQFALHAEEDRDGVVDYLLHRLDNRQAAIHFLDQVDAVVASLEEFPLAHPWCEESRLAALGYRKASFPEMSYVAIFKVMEDGSVVIARIFHTRQNFARLL